MTINDLSKTYALYLTKQKFSPILKTISIKHPTYIFGGAIRNYLINLPPSDIDIKIIATKEEFVRDFPMFIEKENLSNQTYYTYNFKGMKIDISLLENYTDLYSEVQKNNYFFNNFNFNIRESSFETFKEKTIVNLFSKNLIYHDESNLENHINYLYEHPITFLKCLRFYTQSNFAFQENYFVFLKQNQDGLFNSLDTLSDNILQSEFITILSSNQSDKFIKLMYKFYPDKTSEDLNINNHPFQKNTPLSYILAYYALCTDVSFINYVCDIFHVSSNIKNDCLDFMNFYHNENSNNMSKKRKDILYTNYKNIIKKQLFI